MTTASQVLPEEVRNILKTVLENEKFQDPKITFQAGSSEGEGFIAVNLAVEVTEGNRVLNLFVKIAPKDQTMRHVFCVRTAFVNEVRFYRTAYPAIADFYQKRTAKQFNMVPKFYAANDKAFEEAIVLGNLRVDDFTLYGGRRVLSKEHVQLVMREYGKFHGISFAMKEQEPTVFAEITEGLPDLMDALIRTLDIVQDVENKYNIFKEHWHSPNDDELLEKVNTLPSKFKESLSQIAKFAGDHRVLVHGDCWSNNMMYRKKSGQLELRLIDFQGIKYSSVAADLCYFFYASAASEENLALLDSYLDMYYESLSSTIMEMGSDPEKLCPRHVIKEEWKIFCMFGLLLSSVTLALVAGIPVYSEYVGVKAVKPALQDAENEKEYARLMKPILRHFVTNGFL